MNNALIGRCLLGDLTCAKHCYKQLIAIFKVYGSRGGEAELAIRSYLQHKTHLAPSTPPPPPPAHTSKHTPELTANTVQISSG